MPYSCCAPPRATRKAGHHFVEDQQGAVLRAQLAQDLQESRAWRNAVHVAGDRFDDDAGDLAALLREQLVGRVQIVVGQGQGQVGERLWHAGRSRHAESQCAGTCLDQERVAVAVVTTLEFHHLVALGKTARDADRGHGCLGAGIDHAQHLHGWHQARDGFGHRHFRRTRCGGPALRGMGRPRGSLLRQRRGPDRRCWSSHLSGLPFRPGRCIRSGVKTCRGSSDGSVTVTESGTAYDDAVVGDRRSPSTDHPAARTSGGSLTGHLLTAKLLFTSAPAWSNTWYGALTADWGAAAHRGPTLVYGRGRYSFHGAVADGALDAGGSVIWRLDYHRRRCVSASASASIRRYARAAARREHGSGGPGCRGPACCATSPPGRRVEPLGCVRLAHVAVSGRPAGRVSRYRRASPSHRYHLASPVPSACGGDYRAGVPAGRRHGTGGLADAGLPRRDPNARALAIPRLFGFLSLLELGEADDRR